MEALCLSFSLLVSCSSHSNCHYLSLSVCFTLCPSIYLMIHRLLRLSTPLAFSLSLSLPLSLYLIIYIYPSINRCILLSFYLSAYQFIYLPIILPLHLSIQLSIVLCISWVSHCFNVRTIEQEPRQGVCSKSRKGESALTPLMILSVSLRKEISTFRTGCFKRVFLTFGEVQNPLPNRILTSKKWSGPPIF